MTDKRDMNYHEEHIKGNNKNLILNLHEEHKRENNDNFILNRHEASCSLESKMERLDKQFSFILEADKEKMIGRQTYLSTSIKPGEKATVSDGLDDKADEKTTVSDRLDDKPGEKAADSDMLHERIDEKADDKSCETIFRKENDAEHAWHLALMTILLQEYANEPIDVLKTVTMVLIHDIVEIDAGDTYAYDEAGKLDQKEREERAAKRIYGMLPADQGEKLYAIWKEFEERKTPEAKFARAMDNLQPMMLNHTSAGKAWEEHGVLLSQILKRNQPTPEGSKVLWEYGKEHFLKPNVEKGKIKEDCSF